jgi:hypothetical protein
MELILILLGAGAIGYLVSRGGRGEAVGGGGGGGTEPHKAPDCATAINTLPEPLRSPIQAALSSPAATKESLMALAKTLDTCPYPTITDQCAFVATCIRAEAAKRPSSGGSGTSTIDETTCKTLIETMPETTEDDKNLKKSVKQVWDAPIIVPAAVVILADTIENLAKANEASDPSGAAKMKLVAGCLRGKAAKAAGGIF